MKKAISILLCLVLVMSLAVGAFAADNKPVVISLSHSYTELDQVSVELKTAAQNIYDRTDGMVTLNLYPSNSFGSMADGLEAIYSDAPLILMTTFGLFDDKYPDGSAFQCGFVFQSGEEFIRVMDTDIFAKVVADLDTYNVHTLNCSFVAGMRQVIGKEPYTTPEAIKGLKLRVPKSTTYIECFEAIGASPIGMDASEQLSALSAGTIDALDQSISLMYSTKSYELVNQVTLLNQQPLADLLFCSTTWWNNLPEEYRTVIDEELNAAGMRYYEYSVENEANMRAEMEAAGVVFNEADADAFYALGGDLVLQYGIGEELRETVQQIRADIAAGK